MIHSIEIRSTDKAIQNTINNYFIPEIRFSPFFFLARGLVNIAFALLELLIKLPVWTIELFVNISIFVLINSARTLSRAKDDRFWVEEMITEVIISDTRMERLQWALGTFFLALKFSSRTVSNKILGTIKAIGEKLKKEPESVEPHPFLIPQKISLQATGVLLAFLFLTVLLCKITNLPDRVAWFTVLLTVIAGFATYLIPSFSSKPSKWNKDRLGILQIFLTAIVGTFMGFIIRPQGFFYNSTFSSPEAISQIESYLQEKPFILFRTVTFNPHAEIMASIIFITISLLLYLGINSHCYSIVENSVEKKKNRTKILLRHPLDTIILLASIAFGYVEWNSHHSFFVTTFYTAQWMVLIICQETWEFLSNIWQVLPFW